MYLCIHGDDALASLYSYIRSKMFQAIKWLPKFMLLPLNVSFYFKHILDHLLESITSFYYLFLSGR